MEFTVTMQPGDNFRVAASCQSDEVSKLQVTAPDNDFYVKEGNDPDIENFNGKVTPMLTVWRRLHVEMDSMSSVPETGAQRNSADGQVVQISGTVAAGQVAYSGTSNHFVTGLPNGVVDNSQHLPNGNGRFENGRVRIGLGLWTDNLLGNAAQSFWTKGTSVSGGTSFHIPFTAAPPSPQDPFVQGQIVGMLPASQTGQGIKGEFIVDTTLTPNALAGGTLAISNHSFSIIGNTANRIEVDADDPVLSFALYDDDSFVLPELPDSSLLQEKFKPAYVVPLIDGGGDLDNNTDSVGFTLNVPQTHAALNSEFDKTNAFQSEPYRSDDYWISYILVGYQAQVDGDYDPNGHAEWGPIGLNGGGISGRRGAMIFMESLYDYASQEGLTNEERQTLIPRVVVHEIGHQFGIADNTGGLYSNDVYDMTLDPGFEDEHLDIIRSTINPGN